MKLVTFRVGHATMLAEVRRQHAHMLHEQKHFTSTLCDFSAETEAMPSTHGQAIRCSLIGDSMSTVP